MKKRVVSFIMTMAITIGILGGCGSEKASDSENGTEEVTLQFLANETTLLTRDFWQMVADRYHEQNPDVTIELIYQPSSNVDVREYAKTLLSTGQFPDIMVMTTASDFVSADALLPFDESDVEMVKSDYISKIDGKIYVIPYKIQTGGVFYNKDMFNEYGVKVPETWEEFVEVCEVFYNAGVTPIVMGLKDGWAHVVPYGLAAANDVLLDDPDWPSKRMNGEVSFAENDGIKSSMEKYSLMMNKYNVSDKNSMTYAQSNEYFYSQKAPMYIMGSWVQGLDITTEHDFETGFFPLPGENGETVIPLWVNEGLSISAETEYPEIAKDFVRFFLEDEEWAKVFLETEQLFSPLKEAVEYESTALHEEVEQYLNKMEGRPNFFDQVGDNAWVAGVSDLLTKTTLDVASDESVDIQKALEDLDVEVDKILESQ